MLSLVKRLVQDSYVYMFLVLIGIIDFALLAFRRLRPALDSEEMWRLLSMIASEKELRVHDTTELEDMIEQARGVGTRARLGNSRFVNLPDDNSEEEALDEN